MRLALASAFCAALTPAPPVDSDRERRALAFLQERHLAVSIQQLQTSAREGRADEVEALLDAGIGAAAKGLVGSALDLAAGLGCASKSPGDVEGRLATLRLLIQRGADVKAKDPLGNTVLFASAQHCALPIVRLLVESGAPVHTINAQGTSPLAAAFQASHWDVAEYLVEKGARLKRDEIDAVFFELPSDPDQMALIRRATAR